MSDKNYRIAQNIIIHYNSHGNLSRLIESALDSKDAELAAVTKERDALREVVKLFSAYPDESYSLQSVYKKACAVLEEFENLP